MALESGVMLLSATSGWIRTPPMVLTGARVAAAVTTW